MQIQSAAPKVRHSKNARRRAAVLIGVHALIALHIWHWKSSGNTLSPVEPSEAMQTLEVGLINAGFIFFALAILSTLIFGRFMCGWACHLVALQDLCGSLLRRVGIHPKPIRSRLLVWVPVWAAIYMFLWPTIMRIVERKKAPAWVWHLTTDDFWKTFPSWPIAVLTFAVCGFLIVYVLGNKAFCTYGCPYGGVFFWADKVAPGRIRVTEDCNQCGHCTSVCTSNVRVHEEVNLHRMVVDSGCMKCMDCVSVCPKGALYYGFGSPKSAANPLHELPLAKEKRFDFTWPEEIAMAAIFALSVYAFRGLYEQIPFLFSLGIAAIVAFSALHGFRLFYSKHVRFQRWQLKAKGRLTPKGWVFAIVIACVAALTGHSTVLQYHVHEGARYLELAQAEFEKTGQTNEALSRAGIRHYDAANKMSLVPVAEQFGRLGSLQRAVGDNEPAIASFHRALELDRNRPNTRYALAQTFRAAGKNDDAMAAYRDLDDWGFDIGVDRKWYAAELLKGEDFLEAQRQFELVLEKEPKDVQARLNVGLLIARRGDYEKGQAMLAALIKDAPDFAPAYYNSGLIHMQVAEFDLAARRLRAAVKQDPKLVSAWGMLSTCLERLKNVDQALQVLEEGLGENPTAEDLKSAYKQLGARYARTARTGTFLKALEADR